MLANLTEYASLVGMKKSKLPITELVHLYQDKGRSVRDLAKLSGMSTGGVRWNLKRAGCEIRSKLHPEIATADLVRLYERGLSPERISEQIGMRPNSIRYRLKEVGELREKGWGKRKTPTPILIRLYVEEMLSLKELAKRTGMSKCAIRSRLVRAGVERRSPMARGWADPKRRPTEHPTVIDIAWAAGVYEGEGSVSYTQSGYGNRMPFVSITQKDQWLCARLRALFGGTVLQNTKQNGSYDYWRLTGPRGVGFLMTIYKFLSPRRQQQIRDAFAKSGVLAARAA